MGGVDFRGGLCDYCRNMKKHGEYNKLFKILSMSGCAEVREHVLSKKPGKLSRINGQCLQCFENALCGTTNMAAKEGVPSALENGGKWNTKENCIVEYYSDL